MTKHSRKTGAKADHPKKPHPDFPLFPHASGRWAKKIRGQFRYFGKVADDPKGEKALAKWLAEKDERLAGRMPQAAPVGVTVRDLANHFCTFKRNLLESGEIVYRSFAQYYATCESLIAVFGDTPIDTLTPDDFQRLRRQAANRLGPVALSNEIQRVRSAFKYAFEAGLTDRPPRFGPGFKKPSAKTLRQQRAKGGSRLVEREELLAILDEAPTAGKAMILLGINGGLGNGDIGALPTRAVNLKTGWLVFPRPKTGIERRIPLWPETVAAIKTAILAEKRPKPAEDDGLMFHGRQGKPMLTENGYKVGTMFVRAATRAGKSRKGLSFYSLRHTFQTIGEGARDLAAVQAIMGHAPSAGDMSATYRERVNDERLTEVTNHVRKWLFGTASLAKPKEAGSEQPPTGSTVRNRQSK